MIQSLKELAVVLAIALLIFWLARPIALQFMREADFSRRCNVWLALPEPIRTSTLNQPAKMQRMTSHVSSHVATHL